MDYYIKKLGHQEMGSVDHNGRPARGRYIYVSKDPAALSIFPALSETVKNDSTVLPIIPFFLRNKKIYCNLIYHNDKHHGSTARMPRDEYRMYSNNKLEDNKYIFEAGDIVVIRKGIIKIEEEEETVYFLDLIKNINSSYYKKCEALISSSNIRGRIAVFKGILQEFEINITSAPKEFALETEISPTVTKRIEDVEERGIEKLFDSVKFRDFVMQGYGYKCAVTQTTIKHKNLFNLEAAHIKPKSHGGLFLPSNGLALSRDIHWAFDKGFFTITNNFKIKVHDEIKSSFLLQYDGKEMNVPEIDFFKPDLKFLQYHQENIYGVFISSGRL